MAATPYIVLVPSQDDQPARTLVNGVEAMVVMAETSQDAVAICKAQFEQDVDGLWNSASVTALAADANLHGWKFRIQIRKADNTVLADVSVIGDGSGGVAATGALTSSANYADTETVTIGSKVYTFQTALTNVDGHVKIGADEAASIANLHHAINGAGGVAGTDYAAATTAHPDVTATDDGVHVVTVTAKVAGTAGNAIATTETSATAAWGAATLAGGLNADRVDSLAAQMVTALNAAGAGISHASYDASGNVLTVADVADNLGDCTITVTISPPDFVRESGISGLVGAITDGGVAAAAITVALAADNYVLPLAAFGGRAVA